MGNDPAWASADALHVRFSIEEGRRVDIARVDFEIAPGERLPYEPAFLLESIDAKAGEPFRDGIVRSDGDRLRRLLGDAGYPQATVEPTYDRNQSQVHLVWQVKLGPPLQVGPIFVRGNFLTSERTIRRWTLLRPGDPLTTTALERSQRNLALIQIFNNASPISFPPEAQADNILPMLVEVEERHDHWGVVRRGRRRLDRTGPARRRSSASTGPSGTSTATCSGRAGCSSRAASWGAPSPGSTPSSPTPASSAPCSGSTSPGPTCGRPPSAWATSARAAAPSASPGRCTRGSTLR